ncbi:MAG: hypothetical protein KDB80_18030 [Planctomycetes bacterium]|nr:hypothetical protein [Planctomycetota bacterium]
MPTSIAHPSASDRATDTRLDAVRDRFLEFEARHDLFARRFGDCPAWEFVRTEVHDRVLAATGSLDEKHATIDRSVRAHLREARGIAKSLVAHNPFLAGRSDLLFLGHPRRRREADGRFADPYCDPLIEALDPDALLVERPFHHRHAWPVRTRRIAHLDALALGAAGLRVLQRAPLRAADRREVDAIGSDLRRTFEIDLPLTSIVEAKLALRRAQLPWWRMLLRRVRPRVMFVVVGYGNEIPIEACRSLGIPTVELQHGVISDQNLGYHFPHARKQLAPDYLFTFGSYWRSAAALPVPDERSFDVGFAHFDAIRAEARTTRREPRIVFVSQRSIGRELSRIAVEVARRTDAEVVYKLHPGELASWREDYPDLATSTVRVVDASGPDLYELFATSTVQVGVYSTALFEGLAFGLRTRVVRLPGHTALAGMVAACEEAEFVDGADEIARTPVAPLPTPPNVDTFFAPDAIRNARAALAAILEDRG